MTVKHVKRQTFLNIKVLNISDVNDNNEIKILCWVVGVDHNGKSKIPGKNSFSLGFGRDGKKQFISTKDAVGALHRNIIS